MRIEIEGGIYKVKFFHEGRKTLCLVSRTSVFVTEIPEATKAWKHSVQRFVGDLPNRVLARKLAFSGAVSKIEDRNVRSKLWAFYRSTVRQPK